MTRPARDAIALALEVDRPGGVEVTVEPKVPEPVAGALAA